MHRGSAVRSYVSDHNLKNSYCILSKLFITISFYNTQ